VPFDSGHDQPQKPENLSLALDISHHAIELQDGIVITPANGILDQHHDMVECIGSVLAHDADGQLDHFLIILMFDHGGPLLQGGGQRR
jgi:hypothetical protein